MHTVTLHYSAVTRNPTSNMDQYFPTSVTLLAFNRLYKEIA